MNNIIFKEIRLILEEYKEVLEQKLEIERSFFLSDNDFRESVLKGRIQLNPLIEYLKKNIHGYNKKGVIEFYASHDLKYLFKEASFFWNAKGRKLINLIKKIDHSTITLISAPSFSELNHLPLYFDTVLIEDVFSNTCCDQDELYKTNDESINRWAIALGDYLSTYTLLSKSLEVQIDELLYIIYPSKCIETSKERKSLSLNAFKFSASILAKSFNFPEELSFKEIIQNINNLDTDSSNRIISVLKKTGEWDKTVKKGISLPLVNYQISDFKSTSNSNKTLFSYVFNKWQRIYRASILEEHATKLEVIRGTNHYDWYASQEVINIMQNKVKTHLGMSDEYVGLFAMQYEELSWLHNISWDSLILLREYGMMDEMRSFFKVSNRRLANAPIDDFDIIGKSVSEELIKRLNQEEERLKKDKKSFIKKFGSSFASFSTGVTLGIATATMPALAPLSIPAVALSGMIGTSSVRDIINLHLSRKKVIKNLSVRPISILLSAKNSN